MKFTLEQIDKGLYEAIRKAIVKSGFLPDILLYPTEVSFLAQRILIEQSGKNIIELFPVGFQQSKQEIRYNSIYLERGEIAQGDFSTSRVVDFIEKPADGIIPKSYDKVLMPDYPVNISYTVTLFTNTSLYERIIYKILQDALGKRKFMPGVKLDRTFTDPKFWLFYQGNTDTSGADFIEKQYRYQAKDIILDDPELIYNVPEMNEVVIESMPSKAITTLELDSLIKIELKMTS